MFAYIVRARRITHLTYQDLDSSPTDVSDDEKSCRQNTESDDSSDTRVDEYQVEAIVGMKDDSNNSESTCLFLVKWVDFKELTWVRCSDSRCNHRHYNKHLLDFV